MSNIASVPRRHFIEAQVSRLLERSAAFRALPPEGQREIACNTVNVVDAIAAEEAQEADLPAFVEGLLQGTFHAIVDSSIEQMKAYAELVKSVAESLDASDDKHAKERPRRAGSRQQLLSTMVLMGINRIVVTDGR
jgi:hypothetical protein